MGVTNNELIVAYRKEMDEAKKEELKNLFFEKNKGLAYFVARKFTKRLKTPDVDIDDLASIAMLGMLKAFDKYDPELGYEFSSFAVPVMYNEVKVAFRKIDRESENRARFSLNEPMEEFDDHDVTYDKVIQDSRDDFYHMENRRLVEFLYEKAKIYLSPDEYNVLRARYSENPCNQQELAERFNTHQPTIYRREKRALKKLRAIVEKYEIQ